MNVLKVVLVCLLAIAGSAVAQDGRYPTRPVRLVVPYAPGGNVDITARAIAPGMTSFLGQSIVVDNRPGAGGNLGVNMVAHAAPDGYTLLMGSSGPLSINPVA